MLSATVVGRLTRDAQMRTTANGNTIASFSVATDHGFGDRKNTTFVGVSVFGKDAEFCGKLVKGDRVAVSGAGYLRSWDSNGKAGSEFSLDASRVEKLWDTRGDDRGDRARDDRGDIPF
jgi:single-strand DNA-binding protein